LLVAVLELDGGKPSVSAMARSAQVPASTLRSALGRFRRFLSDLDRNMARRAFSALSNPQLDEDPGPSPGARSDNVVPFTPR
jgi:hypothetical protein